MIVYANLVHTGKSAEEEDDTLFELILHVRVLHFIVLEEGYGM